MIDSSGYLQFLKTNCFFPLPSLKSHSHLELALVEQIAMAVSRSPSTSPDEFVAEVISGDLRIQGIACW